MRLGWLWLILEAVAAYFYMIKFGFGSLLLECIITAIFGFVLAFRFGLAGLFNRVMFYGVKDIFSSLGYGIAGVLLIIPGLISDFAGVIILLLSLIIGQSAPQDRGFNPRNGFYSQSPKNPDDEGEIIDVEIIEESRGIK
ncbi:FxsA family protein [Campylobacter sp. 19-13652]|uniref:FxsA family protein n=1 Tax=Campylobacter sp. 19-13652 TaxID=2840180 RepID=UPI001C75BD3D|nr:FxsA family protein [Campylobacter sp. 19-13652]BCX79206.1 hypothetical protein LBC_06680 [Campylobacter sp. 19-13652]